MRYRRSIEAGASYFFTLVTCERVSIFSNPVNCQRWTDAILKVQSKWPFEVEGEVILPDHLHMIWRLPENDTDYATRIRLVKTAVTKSIGFNSNDEALTYSRALKGEKEVWQRRYWEHLIRDERDFQVHLDYIHFNPVKHGLVSRPRDWPHSTFNSWVARGTYTDNWGADEMPQLLAWAGRE